MDVTFTLGMWTDGSTFYKVRIPFILVLVCTCSFIFLAGWLEDGIAVARGPLPRIRTE